MRPMSLANVVGWEKATRQSTQDADYNFVSFPHWNNNFYLYFMAECSSQITANLCRWFLLDADSFWHVPYDLGACSIAKKKCKINRKFRVPRKQGANFLGARAQIKDSWVFSSSAWNFRSIEYHHAYNLEFGTLAGLGSRPHVQLTMEMYL
jgi:hypothetical protein